MIVEAEVRVAGSRAATWAAICDVAHAAEVVRGIERIDLVTAPADGVAGLRWQETRILFGKPATVEKWITEAVAGESYVTRAETPGFTYLTQMRIREHPDGVTLASAHETRTQGIGALLMSIPMRLFFKGVIRKAILQDLADYKAAVEGKRYG